ncbi:MAG: glutathione S-transferase family protein [Blastomonas sp.]
MALSLFGHPFSSYCWKVQIALYEKGLEFDYRILDPEHPENMEEMLRHWPIFKFPLLLDDDRPVFESSIIIEYLDGIAPEPRMIPADAALALKVRHLDRVFDNYVMTPMQAVVANELREPGDRHPPSVKEAHDRLDQIYGWLDGQIGTQWAVGDIFTLADCAAAPSLFYADWVRPIPDSCANLKSYRQRLLQHPPVSRCVELARPYRPFFPLGAPDRD